MIIDSHVHIGGKPLFEMKESIVLNAMTKYWIDKIIVSNADSSEFDFQQNPIPSEFQTTMYDSTVRTVNFARNNAERIFVAAWVKPKNEQPDKDFYDLIERNLDVIKAIKFHPYHSAEPFNSENTEGFIRLAQTFSLPVITHTALDQFSRGDLVAEMAKKYPDVKFIMAHLELNSDNLHAIDLCKETPNLYGDTAWVSFESVKKFVAECGSERILFGSDMPIDGEDTYEKTKTGTRAVYQDYFAKAYTELGEENAKNLMFRNAQRIFNIGD